jgi:exopolyphosphatase/guanosine-5'-triphosphate,3'-diphosphate pyrophosphatase
MRVGVIDMGTNSTRILLADVQDGEIHELERLLTITRLGANVDRDGRLAETAMGRTRKAVTGYVERARELGCDVIFASATSAVRDAANGEAFMHALSRDLGIPARTLSGDEEARATFRGVTSAQPTEGKTAVIDVGGGSTEIVVGRGTDVLGAVSLQAGDAITVNGTLSGGTVSQQANQNVAAPAPAPTPTPSPTPKPATSSNAKPSASSRSTYAVIGARLPFLGGCAAASSFPPS